MAVTVSDYLIIGRFAAAATNPARCSSCALKKGLLVP